MKYKIIIPEMINKEDALLANMLFGFKDEISANESITVNNFAEIKFTSIPIGWLKEINSKPITREEAWKLHANGDLDFGYIKYNAFCEVWDFAQDQLKENK